MALSILGKTHLLVLIPSSVSHSPNQIFGFHIDHFFINIKWHNSLYGDHMINPTKTIVLLYCLDQLESVVSSFVPTHTKKIIRGYISTRISTHNLKCYVSVCPHTRKINVYTLCVNMIHKHGSKLVWNSVHTKKTKKCRLKLMKTSKSVVYIYIYGWVHVREPLSDISRVEST